MMTQLEEARRRRVQQHLDAENAHDWRLVSIDFAEGATYDDRAISEHDEGREQLHMHFLDLWKAAPDVSFEVKKSETAGDAVLLDCIMHGTHRATGKTFHLPCRESLEFQPRSEFIANETLVYDKDLLLEQIGPTPAPR